MDVGRTGAKTLVIIRFDTADSGPCFCRPLGKIHARSSKVVTASGRIKNEGTKRIHAYCLEVTSFVSIARNVLGGA